ncbi:MAG TPA: thioredoxin domain-containing protein [Candidatus Paceibacterota bacterium]|jgi:protein-disulfide isomerase
MASENVFMERYLTPLAVLLGAVLITLGLIFGGGLGTSGTSDEPAAAAEVDVNDIETDNSPSVGQKDAPVTVVVWYDFQCRYCKQFESATLSEVEKNYVANGQVRIVYKDFQFLGPESIEAAIYSRAVWEAHPDRWHEWFKRMLTGESESAPSLAGMNEISTSLGLDAARITQLMNDNKAKYQEAVDADRDEGIKFGVDSTPSTVIGKALIKGAQPIATVSAAIDAELKK